MYRTLTVVALSLALMLVFAVPSNAGMFVATAKNFRGALYQGFGPTPGHAAEMAIVKCSQDSFVPPSCRVMCVRMEVPPVVCAPPVRKPIRKSMRHTRNYPANYSWGLPRP